MKMMDMMKTARDIEKHGLDYVIKVCEKTLKATTRVLCNGKEINKVDLDASEFYEVFEKRMAQKYKLVPRK